MEAKNPEGKRWLRKGFSIQGNEVLLHLLRQRVSLTLAAGGLDLGRLGGGRLASLGLLGLHLSLLFHFLLLLSLLGLLLVFRRADRLLSLSLADFGLLVSLGHDIGESGARDGPHELLRSPRPLLGGLFDHALAVFATVQHRPVDLSGVALEGVIPLAFG